MDAASSDRILPSASANSTSNVTRHDDGDVSIADLCDDSLLRVLSFADLRSLVFLAKGTSRTLRRRFQSPYPADGEEGSGDGRCGRCPDLWRDTFAGHNFAPVNVEAGKGGKGRALSRRTDYLEAIRKRQSLWSTLKGESLSGRKRKAGRQCFSLPSRLFNFVPLLPPDMMNYPPSAGNSGIDEELENESEESNFETGGGNDLNPPPNHADRPTQIDPPPVEFACDSFALTSPGTGTEFILLNPFSGEVEVHDGIMNNSISNGESDLEWTMLGASRAATKRVRGSLTDENGDGMLGRSTHKRAKLKHEMYDTPPRHVLFSVDDYFSLDLDEYFGRHTPFGEDGESRRGDVTVDWVGVDSHLALGKDGRSIRGTMVGAARMLNMEPDLVDQAEEELACTEIMAWSNFENAEGADGRGFDKKYVCRAAGSFYYMDICASNKRLYAAFQEGLCPFEEPDLINLGNEQPAERQLMDVEEESVVNEDGQPIRTSRYIYRLPMIKCKDGPTCPKRAASYFPDPEVKIAAQYHVSSFSVDPTGGTLIVGTVNGTVEIWDTGADRRGGVVNGMAKPTRLQILGVREFFVRRHRSMTVDGRHSALCGEEGTERSDKVGETANSEAGSAETWDDLALLENEEEESQFPHKHATSKIGQIYLPRHLAVQKCGFVTKQRNPESGTTLLLWQTASLSSEMTVDSKYERFQITAMINLPLSARCHPEVHFDGRRLVVYGRDHIGAILLVYHVLGTRFDQGDFDADKDTPNGDDSGAEESGGVTQLAPGAPSLRFVNRIRHAGLGGLEYYDSMLLAANERFLVVNTKAGNLVGGDVEGVRNATDGLLVIDLEDQKRWCQDCLAPEAHV